MTIIFAFDRGTDMKGVGRITSINFMFLCVILHN